MSRLRDFWNQPDQYDWLTTLLGQRGMLRSTRIALAMVTASSALVPLTILPNQYRPSTAEVVTGLVAATFTLGLTALVLTRWPTRRQSQAGVVGGALFLGGWSLVQPTGAIAALACTAMAIPGGYIAFFHSAKLLVFNGAIAVTVTAVAVTRLAGETTSATAVSAFWGIAFLNLTLPLAIWVMSRAIGTYVRRSQEDALTGLLNRRAFTDAVSHRLSNPPREHTHLAVIMVDLDNFKRINDTHGHSAGDGTLRAVAELLRRHSPAEAIICRAGGEEFLVALTCADPDLGQLAGRYCSAITGLPQQTTASIGTASARLPLVAGSDIAWRVDELIRMADAAMYAAKRRGGNQAHHSEYVAVGPGNAHWPKDHTAL